MDFPRKKFERFCSHLTIDSKDYGLVRLKLASTQKYFLDQVERYLKDDIHQFVVLKSRQVYISTICLALDLFWHFQYPGTQGGVVVDKEKTRDQFRSTLDAYWKSLPKSMRVSVLQNNRNQTVFKNRSRMAYMVAGGRQSGSLARGAGLNFCHATEISSWSDPEGVVSLQASLATLNPTRLYVFESTARGFNIFQDMWDDANKAQTIAPIFIGWWRKDENSVKETSRLFKVYGRSKLDNKERHWAKEVRERYGVELTMQQWAWWRWQFSEIYHDMNLMQSEHPMTEEEAFVLSGERFFDLSALTEIKKSIRNLPCERYAYTLGKDFEATTIHESPHGELTVWEQPVEGATYVVSADPAYGESETADHFAIMVLRCWPDRVEQVAEYNTPYSTMYGFAWVIAHLCGAYASENANPTLILELSGPGRGVLQELMRMPTQYATLRNGITERTREKLLNLFGSIQHYLYKRPDTFSGSSVLQWETSYRTKPLMMNALRDMLERRILVPRSDGFIEEAKGISQNGSRIAASGRGKDDRVIAMAIGCMAYLEQVQPVLLAQGARGHEDTERKPDQVSHMVQNYLQDMVAARTEQAMLN